MGRKLAKISGVEFHLFKSDGNIHQRISQTLLMVKYIKLMI